MRRRLTPPVTADHSVAAGGMRKRASKARNDRARGACGRWRRDRRPPAVGRSSQAPPAPDRRGHPHRPGVPDFDVPGVPVSELGLGGGNPGPARGHLGGVALPPGRRHQRPPLLLHHGHARLHRRDGGLCLLGLAALRGPADDGPPAGDGGHGGHGLRRAVLRGRRGGHHLPAAGPVPGGQCQAEGRRRPQGPAEPRRQGRHGPSGRPGAAAAGRPAGRGRRHCGPPRRENRDGRHRRRRFLRRRRLAGHGRIRARGSRPGQPGHGRHHQHLRPPAGPGHACRRRNDTGPDGPAGIPGPVRQGADRPPRGPDQLRVRAGGPGHRRSDLRRLAAGGRTGGQRRRTSCRVHGRRRRAGHRLPLRPGPGHPGGAAHRNRPGRAAGHPDQGPAGPRGYPDR